MVLEAFGSNIGTTGVARRYCLVSPSVTPLSRPGVPSPSTPDVSREAGVAGFVAGITGWYIPIASSPTTSGFVVATKLFMLEPTPCAWTC